MNVNEYGLVAGVAVKNFDVYRAGQKCGFEPPVATRLVAKGVWRPNDAGNAAVAKAENDASAIEEAGDQVFLVGVESGTVQIPQNWREQHHTKKKDWASQISGAGVSKVGDADEIIAEAVKDQEDALQE